MLSLGVPDEFSEARRTLVNALETLLAHYDATAFIVVGAQAVYLNAGADDMPVAPTTLDADLVVDPRQLPERPSIREILLAAGYDLRDTNQPGLYSSTVNREIDGQDLLDLLVPEEFAFGKGTRDARLPGNEKAARRTQGLELALFDNEQRDITWRDRTVSALVAGPTALLVSKLHKLGERNRSDGSRLKSKDVVDILRILRNAPRGSILEKIRNLRQDSSLVRCIDQARGYLGELFAEDRSIGYRLLDDAGFDPESLADARASLEALVSELVKAWPT